MAGTVVKIKQSSVAGNTPTTSQIVQGELAINTADQKLYSNDGTAVFEIGASSGSSAAGANEIFTTDFTATNAQTTFVVPNGYNATNDHINVYYNGIKLSPDEYTNTTTPNVVLDVGAVTGATISIVKIQAMALASGSEITEHEFTATASQTSFAISGGYTAGADIDVHVNGVKIPSADFTATDLSNVVLGTAAAVNDQVSIKIIKVAVLSNAVAQTSETGAAILPAGTTAQRDGSPLGGYLRWNTTTNKSEVYNDNTSAWQGLGAEEDFAKLATAGGTMSGDINMGANDITGSGLISASNLSLGDLDFSGALINQTQSNQQIEIRTNGTGYLHANVADLYVGPLSGAVKIDENSIGVTAGTLTVTGNLTGNASGSAGTVTSIASHLLDEDNMATDSATQVPSQQSVKAYVDTQVATIPVGDITSVVAGTGLTGGGTTGDVTVNVIAGIGLTASAGSVEIDSTVATLIGTQTLTNKTINAATLGGTHTASSGLKITGTPSGISDATLELNTTNSGWNRNQIMFSDSNDKVGSFSGSQDSTRYKTIQTLDPNNTRYSTFTINAGSFVATKWYKIASVGTTDFTAIGASANTVGTSFQASGVGSGTGTATIQSYAGDNAIYFTKNTVNKDDDTIGMTMEMNMWGGGPEGNRISSLRDYIGFYGTAPLQLNASNVETSKLYLKSTGDEGSLRFYEANANGGDYIKLVGAATLSGNTTLTLPTSTDTLVGRDTTDTLTNKTLGATAFTGAITTNSTIDTRDVATDGTKLDTIETSATADQTGAQIKTAYEAETNAFTDAQFTKLSNIETAATADQTGAQIKTLYQAETNAFTDAQFTKLSNIETAADVTDATNVVAALTAGTGVTISAGGTIAVGPVALTTVQTASSQSAQLALTVQEGDVVVRSDENKSYMRNGLSAGDMTDFTLLATPTDTVLSVGGNTGVVTAAHIKTAYESNSQTNAYNDAAVTKLSGIETSATADQTAAEIRVLVGSATDSNVYTDALNTKLAAIEALADVTDATNVNAAGALMLSDTTTAGLGIVLDEDNMASDSATKLATQQSIKAYVDTQIQTVPDATAMAIALG